MIHWVCRLGCSAALKRGAVFALLSLLTTLAAPSSAAGQSSVPERTGAWQAVDCSTFKLENLPDNVDCGYVTVPRRHESPGGATIQLGTVILRSTDPARVPDPLFIAQGGPGGSSIDTYALVVATDSAYHPAPNRDLVIWDQRGTLHSRPPLLCPEVREAELQEALVDDAKVATEPEDELAPYRACYARLAREAGDLSAFNSVENAHDVEALRIALGYDRINFYGVSYGTELGQYLLREHPAKLRAVILDAVVPTGFNIVTEVAFVKQRIGEKYFQGCAEDERCNAAFPNLAERFLALLGRLDAEPAIVEVRKPDDLFGEPYRIKLSGKSLEGVLYQALYIESLQPLIPYIVDRAARGDYSLVSGMLLPMILFDETFAEGMYVAVVCAERGDTDLNEADYSGVLERLAEEERADAETLLHICRDWGIELLDSQVLEPVESDVPTLLLSGDFDPITPPAFATRVGETLEHDYPVVFPTGTHGQAISSPCANGIIRSFLDHPEIPPDTSCARLPSPTYMVPGDLMILPLLREVTQPGVKGIGRVALGSLALLLGLFALGSAPLFYAIGWAIRRLRQHGPAGQGAGWKATFSRLAPWLAALAFATLAFFLLALGGALAADLTTPALLFLGAILSEFRWVFVFPLLFALFVALMAVATVALWTGPYRSVLGRLYYTALTLVGVVVVFVLMRMDLLTAFLTA